MNDTYPHVNDTYAQTNETYAQRITEMQRLTQEYASFSRRRSGLANVLGGVAGLISFLAAWLIGRGVLTALITLGLTITWLVGKEVIRRHLYRPFGEASEAWPAAERRTHIFTVGFVSLVLAGGAVVFIVHMIQQPGQFWAPLAYLVFCLVTPWILWRYLRTVNEFMVGFYLLFDSAITCAGFVPNLLINASVLPLFSLLLIGLGWSEHRQFQALAARVRRQGAQS